MKLCKTKYLLIFIFWMGYTITPNAQVSATDSLKNLLEQNPHDTTRVYLLYKISDQYFKATIHDTAMFYARQAYILAREIAYEKGQARSLTRMGNIYEATGDFPEALKSLLSCLEISEKMNDLVGIGAANNNIARVYTAQKTPEDFNKAIIYYRDAKNIFEHLSDHENLSIALMNIGDNYEKMDQLDSAWHYQMQAYKMAMSEEDINLMGITLVNLGYIHYKRNKIDSAFTCLRTGIQYLLESEDWESLPDAWNSISDCFRSSRRPDSAIYYAKKSFDLADERSNLEAQLDAAKQLSDIYAANKQFDSAYVYSGMATLIDSSLFDREKTAKIQALNFKEKERQFEREEARIAAAKKRKDNLQIILISGFIITFFIVLIILSQKKINPRAIEILGVLGLLLVFEFITIFIHPFIGDLTHHTPIYMLGILVLIASVLGPLHHSLTKWLKKKLVRRTTATSAVDASATHTEPAKVSAPEDLSYASSHKKVHEHEKNENAPAEPVKHLIKIPPPHEHKHVSHKKENKKGKH